MYTITRAISSTMQDCELTHLERQALDVNVARQQHALYNEALRTLNVEVIELDEQAETTSIAEALSSYRELKTIKAPGTLDGGDVLIIGHNVYVGLSSRSNENTVEQLAEHLASLNYQVTGLHMGQCLHLKTAVTALDDNTVLLNPEWIDRSLFEAYKIVEVDSDEPFGTNVVRVSDALLYATTYPKTLQKFKALGYQVTCVDMSELAKAEGAVTGCSLIFN